MAQRWTGFGDSDRDRQGAVARNREWEEFWGAEDDWGEQENEDEDEDEEEEREYADEDEDQGEIEDEDEDGEWRNMIGEKPEENVERKENEEVEEEDEEDDSRLPLEALRILDRLKDMECPFLKGFYKSKLKTARQFLCTPSVYRLDILAWLFTRLYVPLRESFDTWQDSNTEEKIIELTRIGHELLLCGPDDQDLIKGCAQEKRQLTFMNALIDLIESLSSEFGDNLPSENLEIRELIKKKKMMLTKFCNPDPSQETSDPKPSTSLPARKPSCEKKENRHGKPLEAKKTKVEELSEKLTKLTEMLQAHKEEVPTRQDSVSRLFLPNRARRPVQAGKAVDEVRDVKAKQKAHLSGAHRMVTLGSQSQSRQTSAKPNYTDWHPRFGK
uniref:HAUS augmin-like complex subunit 7 n=1 Tax=Phascolarctos cinereus TaxID=38626 RepID=A0A6P5JFI7_PHACI|nr:HAUS augmin-like complex subunit 7 [Phascolarctos cinereus]